MTTIKRFHLDADRYLFDFKRCKASDGWAQVDTSQDASYYGTWCNPFQLKLVTYCEGDVTIQNYENPIKFSDGIRELVQWNKDYGHKLIGIDPGFNDKLKTRLSEYGLGDLLH